MKIVENNLYIFKSQKKPSELPTLSSLLSPMMDSTDKLLNWERIFSSPDAVGVYNGCRGSSIW